MTTDDRVSVPGEPAGQRAQGWFRSPGGVLAHADGPSQVRAFVDRGYTEVDEDVAVREVGDGIQLRIDRTGDTKGTFDADEVARAVREEAASVHAARSAAAKKAAATRAANKAAEEQGARDAANEESDSLGAEG